jgi:hypothetical protein
MQLVAYMMISRTATTFEDSMFGFSLRFLVVTDEDEELIMN